MIEFHRTGVEVTATPERLRQAREEFAHRKLVRIPGLLSAEAAEHLRRGIARDGFEDPEAAGEGGPPPIFRGAYQGGKVGEDLRRGEAARWIAERTNDASLLGFVAAVAGSPPLARCVGRIFRLHPMAEDLPWHTDAEGGRLADLVISLNTERHEGGRFQMRDAHTREVFHDVDGLGFGDALLVRISPDIEHHYTAITGTVPKVTFSGWFVPEL